MVDVAIDATAEFMRRGRNPHTAGIRWYGIPPSLRNTVRGLA